MKNAGFTFTMTGMMCMCFMCMTFCADFQDKGSVNGLVA